MQNWIAAQVGRRSRLGPLQAADGVPSEVGQDWAPSSSLDGCRVTRQSAGSGGPVAVFKNLVQSRCLRPLPRVIL